MNAIVKHIMTRIRIQTAGVAFGRCGTGTGLCSYRVRGVDGICAEHLTVESYRILYGLCLYLPTVILTVIWYSIAHSLFLSRFKTFHLCKSFTLQPSFLQLKNLLRGFPGLFTVISEHICFLLLVFSVFTLFSCRFRAVDLADSCWLSSAR